MKFLSKNLSKIKNKTVLLRLDLNEPVDSNGKLLDDFRLQSVLPTIQALHKANCKIIIMAHRGRPDGQWQTEFTLEPIAKRLADLLAYKFVATDSKITDYPINHVVFYQGSILESSTKQQIEQCETQNIIVLENIRFYEGEEKNSASFATKLASLADVYVNDAFAVSHRKSSSVVAITEKLPSYAGLLLEREIVHLDKLLGARIKKPFVLMMGGIKISDKAKTLAHLGAKADRILLGGGLANLLFAAQGKEIGKSVYEESSLPLAKQILLNFKEKIVLPVDVVSGTTQRGQIVSKPVYQIKASDNIFDIGPKTILEFSQYLKSAGTICWNGPLGFFEKKPFHTGTAALARVIGGVGKRKAYTVAGGGETVAAVRETHQFEHYDHVSTGGGAMLEYLSGKELPGIKALN
ncbi:MAG: phosphoglycerate kinase [Candidatus Doudnabacteria bacterium]